MTDPKVALVTGGGKRIGAAIVRTLHERGCNILIHYNQSMDEATALAQQLNSLRADSVKLLQADLCLAEDVIRLASEALQQFEHLDLLVNNASQYYSTPLTSASQADWDNLINSNLRGHFFLSQALAPELVRRNGSIVNIADIYADRPLPGHSIYNIAKAGVKAMTRALAADLAPEVRVNGVSPGAILWGPQLEDETKPGVIERREKFLKTIPLGRLGSVEEVSATVCYLALDAHYVTGHTIRVDGGRYLS